MSRGLGKLQQAILDSSSRLYNQTKPFVSLRPPPYGVRFKPADGVCDLRAVLRDLAKIHNAYSHCRFIKATFQAAFSRAVRSLIRRGLLVRLGLIPVAEIDRYSRAERFHRLADGCYLIQEKQTRFCSESSDVKKLNRSAGLFVTGPPRHTVAVSPHPAFKHGVLYHCFQQLGNDVKESRGPVRRK